MNKFDQEIDRGNHEDSLEGPQSIGPSTILQQSAQP